MSKPPVAGPLTRHLPPGLVQALDADRLRRAQLLGEETDAEFFEQPAVLVHAVVGIALQFGQAAPVAGFQRAQFGQPLGIATRVSTAFVQTLDTDRLRRAQFLGVFWGVSGVRSPVCQLNEGPDPKIYRRPTQTSIFLDCSRIIRDL